MITVQPRALTAQNFLSIGKPIRFDFKEGITVITGVNFDKNGDGNGCGKSTLLEACYFAFYGNTMRDLKKEEIVNNIAQKNCVVTLDFGIASNGETIAYRIERGIGPSFCKLFKEEKEITESGIPATNATIAAIIKTSEVMFRNTIMMSLNNLIPFMRQRKNEKRDFVEGIFELRYINEMNKISKERNTAAVVEYNRLSAEVSSLESNLVMYKTRKQDADKRKTEQCEALSGAIRDQEAGLPPPADDIYLTVIESNVVSIKKNIATQTEKLNVANEELSNVTVEFKSNRARKADCIQKSEEWMAESAAGAVKLGVDVARFTEMVKTEDLSQYAAKIEAIDKKRNESSKKSSELSGTNSSLRSQIAELSKRGNICLACNRPYAEDDIGERDRKVETLNKQISDNLGQIAAWSEIDGKLAVIRAKLSADMSVLERSRHRMPADPAPIIMDCDTKEVELIERGKKAKADVASITADIDAIRTELAQEQAKINTIETEKRAYETAVKNLNKLKLALTVQESAKNEFDELIGITETKLATVSGSVAEAVKRVELYAVIKQVLSDDGYRAHVIRKMIDSLNQRIRYYLDRLDANCYIVFDEFFDDKIVNNQQGVECSYDNFSGGEQRRIDLAVLFAFMDVRRLQGEAEFATTFFDEVLDSALSVDGSAKLFEILDERKREYGENAYIVTHKKENLQNKFVQHKVIMEKLGGVSSLREVE